MRERRWKMVENIELEKNQSVYYSDKLLSASTENTEMDQKCDRCRSTAIGKQDERKREWSERKRHEEENEGWWKKRTGHKLFGRKINVFVSLCDICVFISCERNRQYFVAFVFVELKCNRAPYFRLSNLVFLCMCFWGRIFKFLSLLYTRWRS